MTYSHDTDAALLGGLLLAPRAVADVADLLVADELHHPAHRTTYAAMAAPRAAGGRLSATPAPWRTWPTCWWQPTSATPRAARPTPRLRRWMPRAARST